MNLTLRNMSSSDDHKDNAAILEMLKNASLSIVIPAYCEEGNLVKLCKKICDVLESIVSNFEIIFVDDGSGDGTWQEIQELHRRDQRVTGLRLSRNFGHQFALYAGMSSAKGQVVITMDADLQHPPEFIPRLLKKWARGYKIVHTVRINNENIPKVKKMTSWMFYKIFTFLSGVKISSGMADFRLLDRQVVNDLLTLDEAGLFLRGLVQWVGYPSVEIEFECKDRMHGTSKYTLAKMIKLAWHGITSFSIIPLRIGIVFGILTSAFAFYQLAEAMYIKAFTDQAVPGWASTIGLTSLLFGVLFILIGILGEYIGRILIEVRGRPRFIISERIEGSTLDC